MNSSGRLMATSTVTRRMPSSTSSGVIVSPWPTCTLMASSGTAREWDVGYAGLKDRYAITRQWFSIYFPRGESPDLTQLQHPEFKVLSQSRQVEKLRSSDQQGNRLGVVLHEVTGEGTGDEMNETGHTTALLWGRGRVTTNDAAQALELGVAHHHCRSDRNPTHHAA